MHVCMNNDYKGIQTLKYLDSFLHCGLDDLCMNPCWIRQWDRNESHIDLISIVTRSPL